MKQLQRHCEIDFEREVLYLSRIDHSHIIKLLGWIEFMTDKCILLDYAENGSLHDFLHGVNCIAKPVVQQMHFLENRSVAVSIGHKVTWLIHSASALCYLNAIQTRPIMHRDIKTDNILLMDNFRIAKVADFGLATTHRTVMTEQRGTIFGMAPEVCFHQKIRFICR
jgi:mitogen-activated protein kinase kinase kinase 7